MHFVLYTVLIGITVGVLVGLTGIGGGALLIPLLILVLHVPPIIAVGSGAAFAVLTKVGAAWLHWRQGNVEWRVVLAMSVGSVPGALAGVGVLSMLRSHYGAGVNEILKNLIGLLLILIPLLMLLQDRLQNGSDRSLHDRLPDLVKGYPGAVLIGLIGGSLVGLTAIGSGSVIMILLLLFLRRPPDVMVGTDVFHGVILAAAATLGHLHLGTVDGHLVATLLLGSVPGALLGSRLTQMVRAVWLRRILLSFVMAAGVAML